MVKNRRKRGIIFKKKNTPKPYKKAIEANSGISFLNDIAFL